MKLVVLYSLKDIAKEFTVKNDFLSNNATSIQLSMNHEFLHAHFQKRNDIYTIIL